MPKKKDYTAIRMQISQLSQQLNELQSYGPCYTRACIKTANRAGGTARNAAPQMLLWSRDPLYPGGPCSRYIATHAQAELKLAQAGIARGREVTALQREISRLIKKISK